MTKNTHQSVVEEPFQFGRVYRFWEDQGVSIVDILFRAKWFNTFQGLEKTFNYDMQQIDMK